MRRAAFELPPGRLVVLGWGKCALPMLRGALARGLAPDDGLVVVPDAQGLGALGSVRLRESSHPLPSDASAACGRAMLELASSLRAGDVVLALSSGGGSAMLATPLAGLSVATLTEAWREWLLDGVPIAEMNARRAETSIVAGGGLARAASRASSMLTLVVSDVPGDDPEVVASGPMRGTPHVVVARNADAVEAAADELGARGYRVDARPRPIARDAELESRFVTALLLFGGPRAAIACGGESVLRVEGTRPGGRNQHFAASAARRLPAMGPSVLAAIATDGRDGSTEAGGALVDDTTWLRAGAAGLDMDAMLLAHDAHSLLRGTGDLVSLGDTRTNVGDLVIALRA